MADVRGFGRSVPTASGILGAKLDSIPFSAYHILIIAVLALVGFIEGYDLVMTGSLLVLAKTPLHLTGPTSNGSPSARPSCCASAASCPRGIRPLEPQDDYADRRYCHDVLHAADPAGANLRAADHRATVDRHRRRRRRLGGVPIAAELMPAQHRRTYGAIYEMSLAASFTVVPFIGGLLAGNDTRFAFWHCRAGWRSRSCRC